VQLRQRIIRLVVTVAIITLAGPLVFSALDAWGPVVLLAPLAVYFYWVYIRRRPGDGERTGARATRAGRRAPRTRAADKAARKAPTTAASTTTSVPAVVKSSRRGRGRRV
jgi:hypothetical protein